MANTYIDIEGVRAQFALYAKESGSNKSFRAHTLATAVPGLCDALDLLAAEVERTKHHDMYERAYFDVQGVLDGALGPEEEDGAGAGIVADVALLAQRYAELKADVLAPGIGTGWQWQQRIAEIEAADLRESAGIPS